VIEFGAAAADDVPQIVRLLRDDDLGRSREGADMGTYLAAFEQIARNPNVILVVGRKGTDVVATLHLTIIPNLGRGATTRAQIETVRVDRSTRGSGVGRQMVEWAIDVAVQSGCGMIEVTTDRRRTGTLRFYESLGFTNTHHGLKLIV
jgi:GNAT superfamily N-acetyltransferase